MKPTTLIAMGACVLGMGCTRPPADPPGVEQQPQTYHFERSPAQLPTTSLGVAAEEDPASQPTQILDSQGTVRTPRYVDEQTPKADAPR